MTNEEILKGLNEEERKAVLDILSEISEKGSSDKMNSFISEDYKEIPVDIETFLHDPNYLGKGLTDGEGRFTLFPYWEDLLKKIYPDSMKPATCNTLALTGAIGLGKSTEAVIIGLYELYRMMCLKDPYIYYGIMNIDVISFAVINITLDAAEGVAWSKMQNLLQMSPWFCAHGELSKAEVPVWKPKGDTKIELICGSQPRHFIGRALFWSFFDEISFVQNRDVEKQKEKATELISSATARMQSRFMKNDINPTIMVLASSKRTEQSFLETWIENKKKNDSKTTLIIDEPQWVVRPDKQSDKTFKVAIGNKFLVSEVLPIDINEDELNYYREKGYRIIDIPFGYYETFVDNIDIALTDVAGISTTSISAYISGARLSQTKTDKISNPFTKDIIVVGDGIDDSQQYSDFFNLDIVDPKMKAKPLFIHLDMSLSEDKTGIAGVWIKGKKPPQQGMPDNREMYYQLAFVVSVKAPKGHQVSFEKTRNFIYWLKKQGFNIKGITSDTFARSGVEQDFISKGFNYSILSVDRTNRDNLCEPYEYLKNTIYEQRILIPRSGTNLLTEELVGLKRDNNSGKIDHDPSSINSKDSSDALCGAVWNASQHAEEFSYDFGENTQALVEFNEELGIEDYNAQFEESIKQQKKPPMSSNNQNVDFGFGLPQEVEMDIEGGIMIF